MAVAPAEQAARAPLNKLVGGHKAGDVTTVRGLVHHLQTNWPTALTARTCSHQETARFVEKSTWNQKDRDGSDKHDKVPIKSVLIRGRLMVMVKSLLKDVGTEPSLIAGAVQHFHQVSRRIDRVPRGANNRPRKSQCRDKGVLCSFENRNGRNASYFIHFSSLGCEGCTCEVSGGREKLVIVPVGLCSASKIWPGRAWPAGPPLSA